MAGPPQMTTLVRKNPQHTLPEEQTREVAPASTTTDDANSRSNV